MYQQKRDGSWLCSYFMVLRANPVILFCVHSAPSTMEPQCRAVTPMLYDANNQSFKHSRPLQDFQHLKITWKFCLSLWKCLGQFGLWALNSLKKKSGSANSSSPTKAYTQERKKSSLICWAFFLSHYRQSSNVCNTVLVRASKEYKRGFETSPFAASFAQIRALDSKPKCIYAVHRRCWDRHHKKAQSRLINCSLSVTVFRSAQFSGKIWELNVEAKRIPSALLPTHWNKKPGLHPAKRWACSPQPSERPSHF